MIKLKKLKILAPLQKLPKNVGDLGKLIVATALKSCPKSNNSPKLVTLPTISIISIFSIILKAAAARLCSGNASFYDDVKRRRLAMSFLEDFHQQNASESLLFWSRN